MRVPGLVVNDRLRLDADLAPMVKEFGPRFLRQAAEEASLDRGPPCERIGRHRTLLAVSVPTPPRPPAPFDS